MIQLIPIRANDNEISKRDKDMFMKGIEHALAKIANRTDCKTAHRIITQELTTLQLYRCVKKSLKKNVYSL